MIDVGEALTRKIGPLPVVAWGAIVGGGILVARALRGGSSSSSTPMIIGAETGTGGAGGDASGYDPNADTSVPVATVPTGWNNLGGGPIITGGGNAITSYDQPPRPTSISLRHVAAR
jgi:hypothetical protein